LHNIYFKGRVDRGKETNLTGADIEGRGGRKDDNTFFAGSLRATISCIFLPLENNPSKALVFFHNTSYSYWLALLIGSNTLCICVTFFTLSLLFYPEDRGSTFLQNASKYLSDYMASHLRTQ
jgi:hypothetical protein